MTRTTIALLSIAGTLGTLGSASHAQDAKPAAFPDKAYAVLVQGSDETYTKGDVNGMESVLTAAGNRWQYGAGSIRKLLTGAGGDNKTTWANVGKALDAAGKALWPRSAGEQNLVYYHSSHGGKGDGKKNSELDFGDGYKKASLFAREVKNQMPDGHKEYSLKGAFETTCVRTMTYIITACNSGGFIWELTETLADKETRRKYFPMLSDITVMTSADWGEECYAAPDELGTTFSRELYGYDNGGHQSGVLETKDARSAWDVFKYAAEKDISNDDKAYTPTAKFGDGNNATMYVKGTRPDGSGQYEHPLSRHVRFLPALTLGDPADGVDGRVAVPGGGVDLDFSLEGLDAPISGYVPISIFVDSQTPGSLYVDRDILPDADFGTPDEGWFLDYYSFDLIAADGLTFGTNILSLAIESDDISQWIDLDEVRLYNFRDGAWVDTGAYFDQSMYSFTLSGYDSLGTFSVVVPSTPGSIVLTLAGLAAMRRRRG